MSEGTSITGLIIPMERLSEEALKGLIEEFILREGTDYGAYEYSLEQKYTQVFNQIKSGRIVIVFDTQEETTSLLRKEDLAKT